MRVEIEWKLQCEFFCWSYYNNGHEVINFCLAPCTVNRFQGRGQSVMKVKMQANRDPHFHWSQEQMSPEVQNSSSDQTSAFHILQKVSQLGEDYNAFCVEEYLQINIYDTSEQNEVLHDSSRQAYSVPCKLKLQSVEEFSWLAMHYFQLSRFQHRIVSVWVSCEFSIKNDP